MTLRDRINEALSRSGETLSQTAVDLLIMVVESAITGEREACAAVAEDEQERNSIASLDHVLGSAIAARIRAR